MPERAFDEEKEARVNSVDIVATNETPSFQSCTFCLGPHRTPTLHTACASLDATLPADKDDAVIVGDDAGGKDKRAKSIVASSSFTAAENQDSIKSLNSSRQHDPKSKWKDIIVDGLSLDDSSGKERLAIAHAEGSAHIVLASFESNHPGAPNSKISLSTVQKGKRKVEEAEDDPEAPAKINRITAISEAEAFWQNREQKPFEDLPDLPDQAGSSSSLGEYRCTKLMQQPEPAADPVDIQQQGDAPAGPFAFDTPLVAFIVPSFTMDFASQASGVIPFPEWHHVEDPENLGFERLNITARRP